MKRLLLTLYLLIGMSSSPYAQKIISLYNGKVPNSKEITGVKDTAIVYNAGNKKITVITRVASPDLTVFLPEKSKATGIAVIICSGGGYSGVAIDHEGYAIAKRLNESGIAGFVLKYRLPDAKYVENQTIVPLQDAQRAIELVRENAKQWGINPNKIGIQGSSAGGHLAATAGTHYSKSYIDNPHKTSLRPDFMILTYPVISMTDSLTHLGSRNSLLGENASPEKIKEYSNELHVTPNTAPTFITHAVDDADVKVQNSLVFIAALQQNKVPVESFFYANGGHGFGIDNPTSTVQWITPCIDWILKINKK
ncbi:alpha/beta hydrolase [Flavobacterium branchiarum]|uniref:Alpha/beta hydrolase n=1 Tax=Flavobacterium branchiarum TaxID=1114870 RepID=A0ABV5FN59_9FLAO|nr:alpha/beta hydrolase [Flavobacterium branchiarum]MDN3672137.1 alpha/beta hydrolase [Flavobacterium branchiarum]